MSENEVIGRWPFERWTVKQDFCQLTYGEGACQAGATNLAPWSEDLDNAFWIPGGGTAPTVDGGDTVTTSNNIVLTNVDATGGTGNLDSGTGFEQPLMIDDRVQVMGHFRLTAGAHQVTFFARIDGFGILGTLGVRVNTDDGTIDEVFVPGGSAVLLDSGIENISGDDYVVYALYSLVDYRFNDWAVDIVGMQFSSGYDGYVGGYSLGVTKDEEPVGYRKTTAEAVVALSDIPCFNTRSTCQIPEVYDRGALPLHFAKPQQELIKGEYIRPSVVSSTITPGKINPGGTNASASPLGERATISVTFQDHADTDRLVDLYIDQRDYDPLERSTFWAKWRARNPYYMHRELEYESGYLVDGEIVDSITRTFFITGFSGPDASGRVTITAKDALTLANNDKAKAPVASQGKLNADISDTATSIVLTPTGIGDLEYPTGAPFFVRIGKEVIEVERTGGSDTLTVNNRGTNGTAAEDHDQGDTVQLCLEYDAEDPADILYDLLRNYANIPDSFLDKAQWDTEVADFIPNLYSTLITDPTGVATLVGEMCQQMFFTVWFDERDSMVRIRAVRGAQGDAVTELDDNSHLLSDSISWKDKAEELVTQVWIRYGRINAAEKLDEPSNYAVTEVVASLDSESADKNNISRVKEIYSRWIPSTGSAAALELGQAILARFGSAPRECTFMLDAKDRDLWLADFIRLTNRNRVDRFGLPTPVAMQVYEAQEAVAGSKFRYKAQEYVAPLTDGDVVSDPDDVTITITSDHLNVNLRDWWDSTRGDAPDGKTITFVIPSGVTVGGYATDDNVNIAYGSRITSNDFYDGGTGSVSGFAAGQIPILQRQGIGSLRTTNSGAAYPDGGGNADFEIREYPISTALDTGTWPVDVTLNLVIEAGGRLLGEGGNGSTHGLSDTVAGPIFGSIFKDGAPGGDGGHAMNIQHPISITNNGVIRCGSGGGGVCFVLDDGAGSDQLVIPGGGGSGLEISDTSSNKVAGGFTSFTQRAPTSGDPINAASGGQVGTLYFGGRGGGANFIGYEPDGQPGRYSDGAFVSLDLGPGGVAGDAIAAGANLVTWVNKGDVRGAENT